MHKKILNILHESSLLLFLIIAFILATLSLILYPLWLLAYTYPVVFTILSLFLLGLIFFGALFYKYFKSPNPVKSILLDALSIIKVVLIILAILYFLQNFYMLSLAFLGAFIALSFIQKK